MWLVEFSQNLGKFIQGVYPTCKLNDFKQSGLEELVEQLLRECSNASNVGPFEFYNMRPNWWPKVVDFLPVPLLRQKYENSRIYSSKLRRILITARKYYLKKRPKIRKSRKIPFKVNQGNHIKPNGIHTADGTMISSLKKINKKMKSDRKRKDLLKPNGFKVSKSLFTTSSQNLGNNENFRALHMSPFIGYFLKETHPEVRRSKDILKPKSLNAKPLKTSSSIFNWRMMPFISKDEKEQSNITTTPLKDCVLNKINKFDIKVDQNVTVKLVDIAKLRINKSPIAIVSKKSLLALQPTVKLFDVLQNKSLTPKGSPKTPIVTRECVVKVENIIESIQRHNTKKDNFFQSLELLASPISQRTTKPTTPRQVGYKKYCVNIPFSSTAGRLIINLFKDRYANDPSKRIIDRRGCSINKATSPVPDITYDSTYSNGNNESHCHTYTFGRRTRSFRRKAIKKANKSMNEARNRAINSNVAIKKLTNICKPVKVHLTRLSLKEFTRYYRMYVHIERASY